nr:hypothetical protein [Campylobacter jejuni]
MIYLQKVLKNILKTIQNLCIKEINKQAGYNKDFHGKFKEFTQKTPKNQKLKDLER